MRLVIDEDPVEKADRLLKEAIKLKEEGKSVKIEVTHNEMRDLITHLNAKSVIPEYMRPRMEKIKQKEQELKALRHNQENGRPMEQQVYFDKIDVIEEQIFKWESETPKSITQSGITIEVAGILGNKK